MVVPVPVGQHGPALAVRAGRPPTASSRRGAGGSSAVPRVAVSSMRAEADQPAGRRLEGDDRAAGVAGAQVGDAALARGERLGDGADVLVGHVDDAPLERLVPLAVDRPW